MNERIDHSNYEAWLLDRLDGVLTPDQERELETFLLLHPELAPTDDELPTVTALGDALDGTEKAALKRVLPPVGLVTDVTVADHLIARLEGDLDADQLDALRAYLAEHPRWLLEEKGYVLAKLVPEATEYATKRALERHLPPVGMPTRFTMGDFLVARLEGDLTHAQAVAVDRLLATDEAYQRTWALLQATRTTRDTVVFSEKATLKKKEGRVVAFRSMVIRLAAAASVAALIAVGLWFLRAADEPEQRFARVPVGTEQPAPRKVNDQMQEQERPSTQAVEQEEVIDMVEEEGAAAAVRTSPPGPAVPTPNNAESPAADHTKAPMPVVPTPSTPQPEPAPNELPEADVQLAQTLAPPPQRTVNAASNERTMGDLLAGTIRERVLDTPVADARPLDGDDAVAAVDRTLKAVGGERAGLAVERKANGGVSGFSLRLGRNFTISASR